MASLATFAWPGMQHDQSSLALDLRNLSIPQEAKQARNPFAGQSGAWREGTDHFADHCAICHGDDGRGGGEKGHDYKDKGGKHEHGQGSGKHGRGNGQGHAGN